MRSQVLAFAAGTLALGFVASCDTPTKLPTTGSIAPQIELLRRDTTGRASVALQPTSMRARAIGPTAASVDLVLTGGFWTGRLEDLSAGTYEVIIEGIASGQVQYYGRVVGVNVPRGQTSRPVIPFAEAVPAVNAPTLTNTTSFSQRLVFNTVPGATGYTVEYTQDQNFVSGVTSFVAADTNPLIAVTQPGTWYMRTRAILPNILAASVPWSDPRSWIVLEASGGGDAASPQPVPVTSTTVATITSRNLTPGKRSDWHDFDVRAGDSLFVETFAARLTNASPLNTVLNVFKADGATQLATNDDIAGSTDSRIVLVVPATERVKVQVAASNSTSSGHFELRVEIRRLPATPTSLTAVVTSGTSANLTWVDNADNETGYDVERCLGAACTDFALVTTVAANVTTYADAALTLGNQYRYRVRARNTVGTSVFTDIIAAATVAPAAPTALTATTVNNTRIDVAWTDNATNETGYQVERCTGAACDTFTALATLPAGTVLYSDLTVAFNATYRYQVRATNNVLPSTYSNIGTANTIPPTTPTALVATAMGATRIDLAWTDNSTDETGFRIERCAPDGCSNYAEIGTVLANVVTYQDNTVAVNTGYRYRVRAYNVVTGQDYTNVVEVGTRAPAAPTGLAATTLVGIVRLAWTDNASNELGVVVQRCAGAACAPVDLVTVPTSNLVTWDDSSAVANTAYTYRVRAYNNVGSSAPSSSAAASTLIAAPVTVLSGTAVSSTRINLAWTASASQGTGQILGYTVYRCGGACNPATGTVVASLPANAVAFADSTVAAASGYTYAVVPRTAFGETPVAGSATVFASTAFPTAPSGLTGTLLSPTSIRLNWTDNASDETNFEVAQCAGVGCTTFTTVATPGAGVVTFLADTLTFSVRYRFLVRAVNAAGPSPWTDTLSIGTTVPAEPTGLAAFITNEAGNVRLLWTDASTDETKFQFDRCSGAGCESWALLDSSAANTTQFDAGALAATTFRFRVRAVNAAGSSAPSAFTQITGGGPYAAPTGTLATTTGPTSIRISWTDQTDNETVFRIFRCTGDACDPQGSAGTEVGSVPRDSTAFNDTGVPTGALYRYQVLAENGFNVLGSDVFDGNTRAPGAPTALSATTLSDSEIALAWTDGGPYETGYVIERCAGGACDGFAVIDTVPANFVSFNDTGLTPNVTYRYRVQAINPVAASAYSNIAEKATDIPATPTSLSALAMSATRIDLAWTDNATNENNYIVERCPGICSASGSFAEIATELAPGSQAYSDNAVAAGLTYSYRVRALNAGGGSPASNIATATTAAPNDPTNLVVTTLSGTRIQLTWDDNSTRELNFEIWRCTSASCPTFALHKTIPANSSAYVDTVTVNDEYRYRVRAVNNVGPSGFTSEVSANTYLPAAATAFTVTTVSGTRIDLTWTDNATNETGYVLERCSGAGCDSFVVLDSLPVDAAGYQNDSIAAQTSFTYRLYAYNVAGPSAFAGPSTATTITPAAPTGLASVLAAPGQIDLSWTDNANNELQYRVERCNLGTSKCATADSMAVYASEVATLPPGTVTYSDAGLAGNTLYFYRVRATNSAGSSPYTAITSRSTSVPIAPTGLGAVTVLATQVNLSWTDASSNETGFRIERCIGADPCTSFTEVAQVAANATTFVDNTVTAAPVVSYRVVAFNGGGGNASNVAIVSTIVPAAPSAFTAAASGQTTVNLTWTDNATTEVGFYIERCTGLGCSNFVPLDTLAVNAVAFADLTVTAGNVYRYRLRAFGNGASDYTPVVGVATILPNPVTGLVATAASDTRVDLTWSDNTSADSLWNETAFNIYRCATASCTPETLRATVGRDTAVFSDSLLTPGVTFTYRVVAANLAGSAAPSNTASAVTNVPAIPTSLADSTVSATAVRLSWVDNASTETGYEIERCEGSACTTFTPVDTAAANATSRVMSGLVETTVYRFRIRAFNANGSSAYSNAVTAQPNLPPAPTALTGAIVSPTQVNLAWVDNAENETAYIIERCSGSAPCTFVLRDSLASNATSFQDATIAIDTVYQYRVRASNVVGPSAYTSVAVVSTYRPATPTGLVATPISATRVDLTWTDVAANDTVIVVQRCLNGGCSNFLDIDSLPPNATSYSDLTVTVNNTYNYRLRAENAAGASLPSASAQVGTFIPSDPSGLTATVNSATQITLNWTDNSNTEVDFLVERCVGNPCGAFGTPVVVAANAVTYQDATVTAGNFYGYRVIARAGGGNSGPSNTATANTFPAGPVASVTGTPLSATTVRLTWTAATNLSGYQIRRVVSPSDTAVFASVSSGVTDTVVTVTTGLEYNFVVRAVNAAGAGAYAGTFVSMTPPPAPDLSAFPLTTSQVSLAWTDTTARETGFQVERGFFSAGSFGAYTLVSTLGANVTSDVNTVAAPNGRYRYRVRALNAVGAGEYSNVVDLTLTGPAAPSGLAAAVSAPGKITLTWTDNSDSEQQFAIDRSVGDNLNFSQLTTVAAGRQSHVDSSGIVINTAYFYRVRAVNNIGASAYTNEASAVTTVPGIVASLGTTILSPTSMQLNWNGAGTTGELGFRVYRCVDVTVACTDFTLLDGSLPVDAVTYTDVAASYGLTFRYQVRPYNLAGEPTGNATAARTLVLPTPSLVVLPVSRTSLRPLIQNSATTFTWETGFEVQQCAGFTCTDFAPLATLAANDSMTIAGGLTANGAWYRYRARAVAAGNFGPWSVSRASNTPKVVTLGDSTLVTATSAEMAVTANMLNYVVAMPAGSPTVEFAIGQDPGGTTTNGGTYLVVSRGQGIQRFPSQLISQPAVGDTLCSARNFLNAGDPFINAGENGGCSLNHLGVTTDYFITTYSNPYTNLKLSVLPGPTTYRFNNCTQTGRLGPAQGQCDAAYTGTALQGKVVVSGSGFQNFTVPFSGRWAVTAVGAAGVSAALDTLFKGGRGAQIYGEFVLTAGQNLRLAVGQMGSGARTNANGGGGGGSFVYDVAGATPMLIAGGGGGTRAAALQSGCDASTTAFGVIGSAYFQTSPCTVKSTDAGLGGIVSSSSWGSGGAGFNSNGASDSPYGFGGLSWANSLVGGPDTYGCGTGEGGFGGGGSGGGCNGGGGGGGYSGGDGGWVAGGGGSFNAGTKASATAGVGTGHGSIVLKYLGPVTP